MESKFTDPWQCIILRKVRNAMWELLDEFWEIVLDKVQENGEEGPIAIAQWGKWFHHPFVSEFQHAILTDNEREQNISEYRQQKHLCDDAYDSMALQGWII